MRTDAEILKQLQEAVAASTATAVAEKIGLPRCTVSMVARGKYPCNPANVLRRFDEMWNGVECPYLNKALTTLECQEYRTRLRPSNPIGLQHWRACQRCEHNSMRAKK